MLLAAPMNLRITVTVLLLLLSACGGNEEPDDAAPLVPEDINQIWDIRSMTCAGAELAPTAGEYYRLDSSHVVRIEKTSEDDASLCRMAYVFNKLITSTHLGTAAYEEGSTLQSAGTKVTCWNKVNGAAVEPPTSDTIGEFGPESRGLQMNTTAETVTLTLGAGSRCTTGNLEVVLALRNPT
jgi:hypothetical protein